jgi:hypothetical protein
VVGNLAFSSGIHYCIGQPLARPEAATALRSLAERLPRLSLAGPVRRRSGFVIRGPLSRAGEGRRTAKGRRRRGWRDQGSTLRLRRLAPNVGGLG